MPCDPPPFARLHDSELASLVFKHGVSSQVLTNNEIDAINRRTLVYTLGGGGGAPAHLRFFLIIFTPSITFFAILSPKWGVTCVWLSCGGKPPTTMLVSPPTPMQERVGVCVAVVV